MKVYVGYYLISDYEYLEDFYFLKNMVTASYDNTTDTWCILYAHTTSKKTWKQFEMLHKNAKCKFIHKVLTMDSEEHAKFYSDNRNAEIIKEDLSYGYDKKVPFPVTTNELILVDDWIHENYYEMMGSFTNINPEIFNRKYRYHLYNIYYTDDYIRLNGSEGDVEFYDYNEAYSDIYNKRSLNQIGMLMLLLKNIFDVEGVYEYLQKEVKE